MEHNQIRTTTPRELAHIRQIQQEAIIVFPRVSWQLFLPLGSGILFIAFFAWLMDGGLEALLYSGWLGGWLLWVGVRKLFAKPTAREDGGAPLPVHEIIGQGKRFFRKGDAFFHYHIDNKIVLVPSSWELAESGLFHFSVWMDGGRAIALSDEAGNDLNTLAVEREKSPLPYLLALLLLAIGFAIPSLLRINKQGLNPLLSHYKTYFAPSYSFFDRQDLAASTEIQVGDFVEMKGHYYLLTHPEGATLLNTIDWAPESPLRKELEAALKPQLARKETLDAFRTVVHETHRSRENKPVEWEQFALFSSSQFNDCKELTNAIVTARDKKNQPAARAVSDGKWQRLHQLQRRMPCLSFLKEESERTRKGLIDAFGKTFERYTTSDSGRAIHYRGAPQSPQGWLLFMRDIMPEEFEAIDTDEAYLNRVFGGANSLNSSAVNAVRVAELSDSTIVLEYVRERRHAPALVTPSIAIWLFGWFLLLSLGAVFSGLFIKRGE